MRRSSTPSERRAYSCAVIQSIQLRDATVDDRETATRIVFEVLAEYGLRPDPDDADADLAALPGSYTDSGGRFCLLLDGSGEAVGTVGLLPRPSGRMELRKMYFLPRLRGQGAGKAVLDWAIRRARSLGFEVMELETAAVLTEALGLYRAFGFRDLEEGPDTCRCDYKLALRLADYAPPDGLREVREVHA